MRRRDRRSLVEPIEEVALARRYHFTTPVPTRPHESRPDPIQALLAAFQSLARRGVGPDAFAAPFAESPLTFLLDTIQDAVLVRWADGTVAYRNRAAEALTALGSEDSYPQYTQDGVTYERRRMRYREGATQVVVEVISRSR
jgi:PAS domain-containing protein